MVSLESRIGPPIVVVMPAAAGAQRPLQVRLGCATHAAPGKPNEDCYGIAAPSDADGMRRGLILAVADGVSGGSSAQAAAQATVSSVLGDYYATPEPWSVGRSLDRLLRAANDWVWAQNARRPNQDAVVIAVSLMVLKDQHYYLAHVGDTRVYRSRGKGFEQLTVDHTWQRDDMRHVLRRAVGLDTHLVVDFAAGELRAGDTFLMVTDGVWEVLGDRSMTEILSRGLDPQPAAQSLVSAASEHQATYMGRNDATAIVLRVDSPV
jgi:serine/threonine protein phosphatase PrpC